VEHDQLGRSEQAIRAGALSFVARIEIVTQNQRTIVCRTTTGDRSFLL